MLKYWLRCTTFCKTNSSSIKQWLWALGYIFITITGLIVLVFCVVFLCFVCLSSCVLCAQCYQYLWLVCPSSCVLCAQCYQYLWLVCLHPVSCVPNVTSISGLFVFVLCCLNVASFYDFDIWFSDNCSFYYWTKVSSLIPMETCLINIRLIGVHGCNLIKY